MSDMENREWINNYMSLKQVNPANPFTVPNGYFDSLEDHIVSSNNIYGLKDQQGLGGFSVPEGYFEELTENIQSRLHIDGYLNNGENGFAVPADYFETMEQQIVARVLIEETMGGQYEHFTVPDGYFNKLKSDILNKTVNVAEVKKKSIVRKLVASTAFKYATAACFAVAVGGGMLLNELVNQHNNSFLHRQLLTVPVDEIKDYLQFNVDAGETQHMILTESTPVNDEKLKNALQDYADSVQ